MKHSVSFLLSMILLLAMSTTAIAQETAEGFQYRVETDGTVTITGYSGNGGKMSIPSEVEGAAVRTIGNGAFVNNSTISSVYVPEGVTHIGNGVFNNCSGLVNIELPTTLVSIGEGAFEACGSLARIRIPNNITEIKDKMFMNCYELKEIILPSSLKSIGYASIIGCGSLVSIELPYGLETIGREALCCNNKLKSLVIPNSVKEISSSAFHSCPELKSVILPASLKKLNSSMFYECPGLEKLVIPKSVTSINDSMMFDGSYKVNIWGFKGSTAEKLAKKKGIPFVTVEPVKDMLLLLRDENVANGKLFIDLGSSASTLQLTAQTSPENPWPGVAWKSSDAKVASVDASGLVSGLKKGKTTITATAVDGSGKKATCDVNVANLVKEIRITGDYTVQGGKKTTLQAIVLPDTADTKKLDWGTSDKGIATVDTKGVVSAKKLTEAQAVKITATAKDGSGTFAEFIITVVPFAEPLDLNAINNTNTTGSDSRFVGKLYRVTGIIYQAMGPSDGGNALILIEPNVMAKGMGSTLPLEINIWLTPDEFEKIGGISSEGKQVDISVKLTSISRNTLSKDAAVKGYPIQLEFGEYN